MSLALALGPRDSSAWLPRRPWAVVALGAFLWPVVGCFDSDEKYQPAAGTTSTSGADSTSSSSSSTSGSSSTTEAPEQTCQDAISCVIGCALELQTSMLPEPDLTCFLECEEGLNSAEVLHLFRLSECVTNYCIDLGQCDVLVATETTTGGESSSSGGSTTDDTDGTRPNICLTCVLGAMQDESTPTCMDLHAMCI